MIPYVKNTAILLISGVLILGMMAKVSAKVLGSTDNALYANDMEAGGDGDFPFDNAFLNYVFARQRLNKMRGRGDFADLLRKRSYWKQCAFNAVSCFG